MWVKSYGSKWHEATEIFEEERTGWAGKSFRVQIAKGECSSFFDDAGRSIFSLQRETINLNAAGVCFYCRSRKLKQLGLNEKILA